MLIFSSIFVTLISFYLFQKASGSMSVSKLNMISIGFYLYLFLMSYFGLILAKSGVENYALRQANVESLNKAYYAASYSLIMLPLSMIFFKKILKFDTKKSINDFYNNKISPSQTFNDSYVLTFFIFLSFICFLACAYSFYSISYSPLLSILKGYSSEDIAGLRFNSKFDFRGIEYIKNLFFKNLAPFLSLISLGYTKLFSKNYKIKIWHFFNICLAILAVTFNGEKAPLVVYFLMYFIAKSVINGRVNKKLLLRISIVCFSILIYLYILIDKKFSFTFYGGIFSRIFMVPNSGLLQTFELFPSQIDFLNGSSFPSWMISIFGMEQQRSARVIMEHLNPEGVINGTTGVMNSLYIAEAYANFGIVGLLLMPIIAGFTIIYIYNLIIGNSAKTPIKIALFAYFSFNLPLLGGMVGFIWNVGWVVLFIYIYISKKMRFIAITNKWTK
jgi:oligosaccharide repeat unit polymerase